MYHVLIVFLCIDTYKLSPFCLYCNCYLIINSLHSLSYIAVCVYVGVHPIHEVVGKCVVNLFHCADQAHYFYSITMIQSCDH